MQFSLTFQRICEDDLRCTGDCTGQDFPIQLNFTSVRISGFASDEIVHCQFDGLFRSDTLYTIDRLIWSVSVLHAFEELCCVRPDLRSIEAVDLDRIPSDLHSCTPSSRSLYHSYTAALRQLCFADFAFES